MMSCAFIKHFLLAFMLSFFFSVNNAQSENSNQPEVTIPQGILLGKTLYTHHGRSISAFLGIPYAQPPTGNLRFANPLPASGWNGIRNATVDANICPQDSSGNEDCLYLNVYTPQLSQSSNTSLLPVMVFIHGGGFVDWSSLSTLFGPEYMLDGDVVLVTLNYRLGALGFLSTGDEVASGNWGLKDQVLALKWVQNNIEYFGGDRNRVTIFGQSAGAAAVHLLSLSKATIGLFHRYITHSGSALTSMSYRSRTPYANLAFQLGKYFNCPNSTSYSLINCLREVSHSSILAANPQFSLCDSGGSLAWGPTGELDIEGAILTDSPENLFATGQIRDLPWISGTTADEALGFAAMLHENDGMYHNFLENFDSQITSMFGYGCLPDGGVARVSAIKSFYFNNDLTANKSLLLANLTNALSDSSFIYPSYRGIQQQHTFAVNPQYLYLFQYSGTYNFYNIDSGSSAKYGAGHCDDLLYLFPMSKLVMGLNVTKDETDYQMVDMMVKFWTSFAADGIPSINNTITWEPYSTAGNFLAIGGESNATVEMQYSFLKERMQFWANIDETTESSTSTSDDSGSIILTPNFPFVLLLLFSVHFLSAARVGRSG